VSGDSGTEYTTDGADEPDWQPDPEDDSGPVLEALGRQIKLWRMAAGLSQVEFGAAIGYGENQVYKVERGTRIPKPEFLDRADQALNARGMIAAMKRDVAEARYPKKVRGLANLEREAVELGAYSNHNVHGLLQTAEYTRALFEMRRPAYSEDHVDRQVEARMARQVIFPLGGRMVLRRQLERLLEVGRMRNVEIQVMPTRLEEHAGMGGEFKLLKFDDGTAVGHWEGQLSSPVISNPKEVRILEMRYGIIRSQALTPRESLAFIEKVLGET